VIRARPKAETKGGEAGRKQWFPAGRRKTMISCRPGGRQKTTNLLMMLMMLSFTLQQQQLLI